MSNLNVKVWEVSAVKPHPNADKLDIVELCGYDAVVGKDQFKAGDHAIFIPVDSIVPEPFAAQNGFAQYLASNGRVKAAKLRGVVSVGIAIKTDLPVGTDVADELNITKYQPPVKTMMGDAQPEDPSFPFWPDIDKIQDQPWLFKEGEEVVITEKIDGTQCRVGIKVGMGGTLEFVAGSHHVNRRNPGEQFWGTNTYYFPLTLACVRDTLVRHAMNFCKVGETTMLVGEVFGQKFGGVKSMNYGRPNELDFRAFGAGLVTDMGPRNLTDCLPGSPIPVAPELYRGPYSKSLWKNWEFTDSKLAAGQIMEGIVIRSGDGTKAAKYINPEYLLLKEKRRDKGEEVDSTDM